MSCILVADDDPLIIRLLEHRLRHRGYDVISAPDGETALDLAIREKPDLILLDGMMPGLDGFEVLRRLKENPETIQIPVVMLTARSQEGDIVNGLTSGAADYMVKPFIPEELIARIQRIVGDGTQVPGGPQRNAG
ncbi:MAG: response regulator [Proteobacteria bacterium]|nr:response regulator [Pseudomonadota bacterium]